jgi:hypothetical protein
MNRSPSRFPGGGKLAIAFLVLACLAIGPSMARARPSEVGADAKGGKKWRLPISSNSLTKSTGFLEARFASLPGLLSPQQEGDSLENPDKPDLSGVRLNLSDMPPGFEQLPESQTASMRSMADSFLRGAGMQTEAEAINLEAYKSLDPLKVEVVWSFLLTPLSRSEQIGFDRGIANPKTLFQALDQALVIGEFGTPELIENIGTLGNRSIAFALPMTSLGVSMRLEAVIARRGEVVEEVWAMSREGVEAEADVGVLARLLDERLATALGPMEKSFRPAGPLVPSLTTYIPTPLDVSTEPSVVGANLLLAALVMLPFAAAAEVFTRTLTEHEEVIKGRFPPFTRIFNIQAGFSKLVGGWLRGGRFWLDLIRLLAVVLFYGLVFSFLDPTWKPFSLTGLVLLFNMTVAYGLIGLADDLLQWRALRRWGLPGEIGLRLSGVIIAVVSTLTSRLLVLTPGLMFGTPEALQIDEEQFDQEKQGRFLKISAFTLVALGFGLWLPTLLTSYLQGLTLPASILDLIGGLEGFFLVVFAVALENLFVQMLGFPGGFGRAFKQRHRWWWLGGLILIAFLFYHTLLNPRGDLAQGLQESSVKLFLIVSGTFVIFAFGLWLFFQRGKSVLVPQNETHLVQEEGVRPVAGVALNQLAAEFPQETRLVEDESPASHPAAPGVGGSAVTSVVEPDVGVKAGISPRPAVSTPSMAGGEVIQRVVTNKICPNCGVDIKAEALVCWHCQAKFAVQAKGYCLSCHAVVLATDGSRCSQCGGELADPHIESRWLSSPSISPVPATPLPKPTEKPVALPTPRRLTRWLWLVPGAILVGGAIWLVFSNLSQPKPETQPLLIANISSPTPTHHPVPTRTPIPTPTRTPLPPTPTLLPAWINEFAEPVLAAVVGQKPTFESDFSTGAGRIQLWRCQAPECVVADGVMRASVENADLVLGGYLQARDFLLQFEVKPLEASPTASISAFFRHVQGTQTRVSFEAYPYQGRWIYHRDLPGAEETFAEDKDAAIRTGETLMVQILAYGDQTAVYLNQVPLVYATDDLADGDWIFFGVNSPSGQTIVQFDNLKFWNLENMSDLP